MRTAMFASTRPPVYLKKKSPRSNESSPTDTSIFWSKREYLSVPQFMPDRTVELQIVEIVILLKNPLIVFVFFN